MLYVLIFAITPVPLFYLIYLRHFQDFYRRNSLLPQYLKHFESLLFGILLALITYLSAPLVDRLIATQNVLVESYIKAAFFEKAGAVFFIYIIHRNYPSFSLLEAIITGVLLGTGFSFVENILYVLKFGDHIIIARTLFSTPLHITTCGIAAYFIGQHFYHEHRYNKTTSILIAFLISALLHGTFDMLLIAGGAASYAVGPMMFLVVMILEITFATSKLVPAMKSLQEKEMDFQEWKIIFRQPRYERWIRHSMGIPGSMQPPFFRGDYGPVKSFFIAAFFGTAIAGAVWSDVISGFIGIKLNTNETFVFFSVFPASAGITLLAVGAVNPSFLKNSIIRIPIIFDAVIMGKAFEETIITFDITSTHCFLRSGESMGTGSKYTLRLECNKIISPVIPSVVTWENHINPNLPSGTIIRFKLPPGELLYFLIQYYFFRITRGIIFSLKLPGFQIIRRLFMSLSTIMSREIRLKSGSLVFREGELGNSFFFIKKGGVELFKTLSNGERVVVDTMGPGQVFNEMSMLGMGKRTVSAVCTMDSVIASGDIDSLDALIRNNPNFALALIHKLSQRIDNSQKALMENIEYFRELLNRRFESHYASLVILLISMGLPQKDGAITVQLDPDLIEALSPRTRKDLADYLRHRLLRKDDDTDTTGSETVAIFTDLEKMLSDVTVHLTLKDKGNTQNS